MHTNFWLANYSSSISLSYLKSWLTFMLGEDSNCLFDKAAELFALPCTPAHLSESLHFLGLSYLSRWFFTLYIVLSFLQVSILQVSGKARRHLHGTWSVLSLDCRHCLSLPHFPGILTAPADLNHSFSHKSFLLLLLSFSAVHLICASCWTKSRFDLLLTQV